MRTLCIAALAASLLSTSVLAWEVSPEQLSKIQKPVKKPIEDLMPPPPPMVTEMPLDLMTPDEKLGKALVAFRELQSARINCLWSEVWLGDTSKIMLAAVAYESVRHRLNKGAAPKRFSRGAVALVAALSVAHVWNWLANSERVWSIESWLSQFHDLAGLTSGDQRADYFTSSDQAFAEFLRLQDEKDIRDLLARNPKLLILTLNYRELVRQAQSECRALQSVNQMPWLGESDGLEKLSTSPAQP